LQLPFGPGNASIGVHVEPGGGFVEASHGEFHLLAPLQVLGVHGVIPAPLLLELLPDVEDLELLDGVPDGEQGREGEGVEDGADEGGDVVGEAAFPATLGHLGHGAMMGVMVVVVGEGALHVAGLALVRGQVLVGEKPTSVDDGTVQ